MVSQRRSYVTRSSNSPVFERATRGSPEALKYEISQPPPQRAVDADEAKAVCSAMPFLCAYYRHNYTDVSGGNADALNALLSLTPAAAPVAASAAPSAVTTPTSPAATMRSKRCVGAPVPLAPHHRLAVVAPPPLRLQLHRSGLHQLFESMDEVAAAAQEELLLQLFLLIHHARERRFQAGFADQPSFVGFASKQLLLHSILL